MPRLIDITGQRFGQWVVLGLAEGTDASGYRRWSCRCVCGVTAERASRELRLGKTSSCRRCALASTSARRQVTRKENKGRDLTYIGAHARVRRDRGRAATHVCIECGQPARHWAYQGTDPDPLFAPWGSPYSIDPANYAPMCVSHHKRMDMATRMA